MKFQVLNESIIKILILTSSNRNKAKLKMSGFLGAGADYYEKSRQSIATQLEQPRSTASPFGTTSYNSQPSTTIIFNHIPHNTYQSGIHQFGSSEQQAVFVSAYAPVVPVVPVAPVRFVGPFGSLTINGGSCNQRPWC